MHRLVRPEPLADTVPIAALRRADSPRREGEDVEHIRRLAGLDVELPPILVHRGSMRVIDGMHRLRAAMLRGRQTIEVRFFDGTDEAAFVRAVEANVEHGLPLSANDRELAAVRIIGAYPSWSDRRIATATGLAAKTVGDLRRRVAAEAAPVRVGRDGRVRPIDSAPGRRRAVGIIAAHPEASLREVARMAGVSPTTAGDVRARLRRGDDPVPARRSAPADRTVTRPQRVAMVDGLKKDPALRFSESGRMLLRWLDACCGPRWADLLAAVPPHCAPVVAELTRAVGQDLIELARRLTDEVSN